MTSPKIEYRKTVVPMTDKKTIINAGFPGVGKTTYLDELKVANSCVIALYIDSSEFSWLLDEKGQKVKDDAGKDVRHPDFPNNYISHIKENVGKVDIIFMSSHNVVRDALAMANMQYFLIYPDKSMKENWMERLARCSTGINSEGFVNLVRDNWENWINGIEKESFPILVRLPYKHVIDIDEMGDSLRVETSEGIDKNLIRAITSMSLRAHAHLSRNKEDILYV
jgi:hypothetical protein